MKKPPIATFVLLGINTLVFAWLAIQQQSLMLNRSVDVLAILHAGANLNPFTLGGEPWRIITSMFLHYGIIHLAVNMYGLYSLGRVLEPAMGVPRFLLLYFLCGFVAGLASLLFNLFTISAGASGAIFGLYGYLITAEVLGSLHDREKLSTVIVNFIVFVVINGYISLQFNVDLSGHIGGCVAGALLALAHFKFRLLLKNKHLALVLMVLPLMLFGLPKNQVEYYRIFQRLLEAESKTDILFRNTTTDNALKDSLTVIMLPKWDSIYASLDSLEDVPVNLQRDVTTLMNYVALKKKETFFRITMVERESYVYMDSIEWVNQQMDSIPQIQYPLNYEIREPREIAQDSTKTSKPAMEAVRVFYDQHWKESNDPSAARYFRIGTRDSLMRWQGYVRDYYLQSGNIQMKGKYFNGMKDGVFLYYSDHGTYESGGRYEKERAIGKWETYHWNGSLESEVSYHQGAYTLNLWDSLGNAQVSNGHGKVTTWYANGKVKEVGTIVAGRREDYWHGYHPDGEPYYEELYHDNRLVRGISVTKDGRRFVYDQLSEFPLPEMGMEAFNQYLETNRREPNSITPVHGVVKVVFHVGTDGSLWDFVVMESVCGECDQEAIRLIKEGPAWRPALLHGHEKVQSQGYVEVEF